MDNLKQTFIVNLTKCPKLEGKGLRLSPNLGLSPKVFIVIDLSKS